MRYIFILLVTLNLLNLDADMLAVHKRIVPISLFQIKKIVSKDDKIINLDLIVKDNQIVKAIDFQSMLPKYIKSFILKTKIIKESQLVQFLKNKKNIDALYCFDISKKSWDIVKKFEIKNNIVVYSYSKDGLNFGALLYIELTDKVHLIVNKKILKSSKVIFNNQFLQILDIYDKN